MSVKVHQRFPTVFVCVTTEVANGMWPATLPWKRQ